MPNFFDRLGAATNTGLEPGTAIPNALNCAEIEGMQTLYDVRNTMDWDNRTLNWAEPASSVRGDMLRALVLTAINPVLWGKTAQRYAGAMATAWQTGETQQVSVEDFLHAKDNTKHSQPSTGARLVS